MRIVLVMLICICSISLWSLPPRFPLRGKTICVDAGHGGTATTDNYRVGTNGEREEWINLRVALLLKKMLEKKGAEVVMIRTTDTAVDLAGRAILAVSNKADAFISIHHNATADRTVNFPIVYFHGAASENRAGVELGKILAWAFQKYFYRHQLPVSLVSDHTIFPAKGAAVLRNTYGIPGLIGEASFFTNEDEERRLKTKRHNRREATAYLHTLEIFFAQTIPTINEKKLPLKLEAFPVLEEADRMNPEARQWLDDFNNGKKILRDTDSASSILAFDLFTRSARSFPDSYVARECHVYRSEILSKLNRRKESAAEKIRAEEYYVKLKL